MKKYNILICIFAAMLSMAACRESSKSEETQDMETNEQISSDTLSNTTSSSRAGSADKNDTNQYQQNSSTNASTSSEKDSNVIFGVEGTGGSDNDARTKDIRENQGRPY